MNFHQKILSVGLTPTFVSFTCVTDPSMRKTDNPFVGCKKITKYFGLINTNWENAVNRKLPDGETYTLGQTWHSPVTINDKATCLAVDKKTGKKFYLRFFPIRNKHIYLLDNKEVPKEEIKPFLQTKPKTWKPDFLTISLDNIVEFKLREVKKELKEGQEKLKKIIESLVEKG